MSKLTAVLVVFVAAAAWAQVGNTTQMRPGQPAPTPAPLTDPLLIQLQQVADATHADIARLQVNKWKMEGAMKQQVQQNADALDRNLTMALPGMIDAARNAPQDLGPSFKLYRNLNVLYTVLAPLADAAGAYGKREEYDALSRDAQQMDSVLHSFGDRLENETAARDTQLAQLRALAQRQAAAAATPPKKIVIDDTQPAKKATKKKKSSTATPPPQ